MLLILVISICLMVSLLNLNTTLPKVESTLGVCYRARSIRLANFHQNYTNLSFFRLLTRYLVLPRCPRWTHTEWVAALVWASSTCSNSFNWWRCITLRVWEWWVALEEWTTSSVSECQAWATYQAWPEWAWVWAWECLLFRLSHPLHNSTSPLRKIK